MRSIRAGFVFSAAVAVCFLATRPAFAQEAEVPAISTERPTVGDSPDLIPAGSFQMENGAGASLQRGSQMADLPESLIRFGLTSRLEARFATQNAMLALGSPGGADVESADTAASVKALIAGPNTRLPKSAVLSLSLPTGSRAITSGSYDPGLILIWTQAFPHTWFVNEVAGATLTTLNGARKAAWGPSVAFGRSVTPAVTAFGEYAPTIQTDSSVTHVIDGGIAITRGKLRQFDLRAGYMRDEQGDHTLLSVGYSLRRDHWLGDLFGWQRGISQTR